MAKILVFSLLAVFTANSFAAIKIWDGGGADAYLAIQEWIPGYPFLIS